MRNIHIISRLKYILLLVITLWTCLPSSYSHHVPGSEVQRATQLQILLNGQAYISPTLVGPALRNEILHTNDNLVQIEQLKRSLHNHVRIAGHLGDNTVLLLPDEYRFHYRRTYSSRFNIQGVPENQANATRICNEIIDLLLSGRVSFSVSNVTERKFSLFANLDGHHISGLGNPPCTFYHNPSVVGSGSQASTYVRLVIGAYNQYNGAVHPNPQISFVTLYPVQNRSVNAPNALAPVHYPCPVRLKHCLYDNRERAIALIIGIIGGSVITFTLLHN